MTNYNPQQAPPGWYQDPTTSGYLRWWTGEAWAQYYHPMSVPLESTEAPTLPIEVAEQKKIPEFYWSNLLRIRTWFFATMSAIVLTFVLALIGLTASWIPIAIFVLVGYFWCTQQMACHHCGTLLRVTRLSGGQEVCHKCQAPTDAQLKKNQEVNHGH
jgi:hypothetical protein